MNSFIGISGDAKKLDFSETRESKELNGD